MTDIRRIADPQTRKYYYPQTHYLAVQGLTEFVNGLIDSRMNSYATYIKDLKSIDTSGLFYFDSNTLNKPTNIDKGYLQAIFMGSKNGIIEVKTTNKYFEIIDGQLSDIKERS